MKRKNTLLNPIMVIIVSFVCMTGMLIGVVLAKNNPDSAAVIEETGLFSGDFIKVLGKSVTIKLLWTFLFASGGLNVFFVPVSLSAIFAKGYTYGFTAGLIVSAMGTRGYFMVTAGLFLHNFLFTLFSVYYTAYSVNKSFECFVNRRNYDYKLRKNKAFLGVTAIAVVAAIFIALAEAGISSYFYEV